jgi:hypothetical protein
LGLELKMDVTIGVSGVAVATLEVAEVVVVGITVAYSFLVKGMSTT